ncbi:SIS domain-containing protein [Yersinia ruckeri]|uniref:SIS domain-containing protein n=1 Tax=Yersinia ruckeri TaxID=29486 RepID=UPI0011A1ED8C|nr:SIS domain-containing protein [Yersinia ruckeri]EKN3347575.1 SIS domain-containing protein [Yersinia ruckeri]EKN4209208.1 SIS domain-containing protein [Yersinia ruckeri]EKN4698952.1 SIS domain-containing protein [Yersinia ruckeri]ELM3745979.1 SIS domain-containing protein [Yersinia ruckeri]MCK8561828.1 SIS domain-containing protein [Yersinia ruckeri]
MTQYLGYNLEELTSLHANWTAQEIEQQPVCWEKTQRIVAENQAVINEFLQLALAAENTRIIFTGAGTSAFAGRALVPLLTPYVSQRIEAIANTDLVATPEQYFAQDVPTLLVSFARSGNSPESVAALQVASECLSHCFHLVLTCNQKGQLYQYCQTAPGALAVLMPAETNDQSLAMTSSFSSMMLAAVAIFAGVDKYPKEIERFCKESADWFKEINRKIIDNTKKSQYKRVIYLGSGGLQGLAQESALKLLELTAGKVVAGFDTPLGFRHGPKSIVNPDTLVVVYISNDPYTRQYDLDLLAEIRANNVASKIIAVAAQSDAQVTAGDHILVPGMADSSDLGLLFAYLMFAQAFAFHSSVALNNTPDCPSPTGEINRVVQGVTIYPFKK